MRLMTFFWIFIPVFLLSQDLSPVSWTFNIEKINDQEYELIYTADIKEGWNVYGQYIDDGGPFPTTITYDTDPLETVGLASEEGYRKEGMDPIFEMNVVKFLAKDPYVIKQRIIKGVNNKVIGYLTYMTCDDERCLPPTDIDFEFTLDEISENTPRGDERADANKIGGKAVSKSTSVVEVVQNQTKASSDVVAKEIRKSSVEHIVKSDKKGINQKPITWASVEKEDRPVEWRYGLQHVEENKFNLIFEAAIDKGWSVYSQFIEEGGPSPTSFYYEEKDGVSFQGIAEEMGAKKEGMDPIFEMNVIKFVDKKPYRITQTIQVTDPLKPLSGFLNYMTCDDEQCLPPTDIDFTFNLEKRQVGNAIFSNDSASDLAAANIKGNVIDQVRPKLKETYEAPIQDCGEDSTTNSSMVLMFFFGFIGGLLALLTPCVFPIIPMTISFFTKDTKRKGWVSGLIYGASIVVIYVTIGLLITALFGEEALNQLSTNWIANTAFFLIFVFFAFSFFGFYEITLPSSWTTSSDKMADKGGLLGIFFMAFTLALVSFSCTGPIIGAALVESASNQVGPFVVMLGFSLGLAIPFGLFAAFPSWLNSLPQSGGWMNSVKVVLGFIELALAFKFLSVADTTSHWGILKYETFIGIWILIALAMAAYGMGWIKFPHDSPVKRLSPRRWAFSILSLVFAGYLASGFTYSDELKSYKPLALMSGIAPPVNYNLFLDKSSVDDNIKSKYPSYSKCANDINCFKDYYEGLAYAKEINKPILIDHTGHGCVNCRRTEDKIWSDSRIRTMLNDDFVLISLYVDDREELEEVLISKFKNKKLRTVGSRWADFEIVNFSQLSQPLYVMVTPGEEVVSIPRGYKEGVQGYLEYLTCGLKAYKAVSMQ